MRYDPLNTSSNINSHRRSPLPRQRTSRWWGRASPLHQQHHSGTFRARYKMPAYITSPLQHLCRPNHPRRTRALRKPYVYLTSSLPRTCHFSVRHPQPTPSFRRQQQALEDRLASLTRWLPWGVGRARATTSSPLRPCLSTSPFIEVRLHALRNIAGYPTNLSTLSDERTTTGGIELAFGNYSYPVPPDRTTTPPTASATAQIFGFLTCSDGFSPRG